MRNFFSGRESLERKAAHLKIAAFSLSSAMQNGAFRSLYKGQGVEFAGVREYILGDDVRAIDWNVTARNGKPFVKIFCEERELQIFLIIDRSLSMQTSLSKKSLMEQATEIAALLALSGEKCGSPLGAILFSSQIDFALFPKNASDNAMILLSHLDEIPNCKKGSALNEALQGAARILKKRSLVFVVSDFRVAGWENDFAYLASKHDVVAIRISDSTEKNFPDLGAAIFCDPESGEKKIFPSHKKKFFQEWKSDFEMRKKRFQDAVEKRGGDFLCVSCEEDAFAVLMNFFSRKREG